MELEQQIAPAKNKLECLSVIREGESLKEFLCRFGLAIYEIERARLGNHSAVANHHGMKRTMLYDWLAWARQHISK
jgi:broad specificity phosphatase PhoE